MNSNFEYYKVFYYVSKYNNITRAAQALRTSQPSITRTIQNLEDELGCRLFIRSKSGMTHTSEGAVLFRYISEGCAQFQKGENALSNMLSLEKGSIYITATETALHCLLFHAIELFNRKYPHVQFKIFNNSSTDSIRMVKDGRADMAVISASVDVEKPLKKITLRQYEDILIGGSDYEDLADQNAPLSQLLELPWISLKPNTITRKLVDEYFAAQNFIFEPAIEVDTTDMILMAVKHNLGIGFIPPEFAEDDIQHGNLVRIDIRERFPKRDINLIYDSQYPQSIAAKTFRDFLKELKEREDQLASGFRV